MSEDPASDDPHGDVESRTNTIMYMTVGGSLPQGAVYYFFYIKYKRERDAAFASLGNSG
jgi:hypothetical protein